MFLDKNLHSLLTQNKIAYHILHDKMLQIVYHKKKDNFLKSYLNYMQFRSKFYLHLQYYQFLL